MMHPSAADLNSLTDARVAMIKAALQLTPDQEKYWPPWRMPSGPERRTGTPGGNGWRNYAITAQWKPFTSEIR